MALDGATCKFRYHQIQFLLVFHRRVRYCSALGADHMVVTIQAAIKMFGVRPLYLMNLPLFHEKVQIPVDGTPAYLAVGGMDVHEELIRPRMIMSLPYSVKYQLSLF